MKRDAHHSDQDEWSTSASPGHLPPHLTVTTDTHTHTFTFNGPFSGTAQVSRYQKGKTNLDVAEARDSEWQW